MTIPEYLEVRRLLKEAPPEVKSFLKDICRAAGHEWLRDPNEFANVCTRCEEIDSWMNNSVLSKIVEPDVLSSGDLPIYDKDIPSQEDKA